MENFKKWNNITGWIVFAISLGVYLLTVAPTASFWDCGEFISCANELEVTHPPGAPLFLLLGRILAMFAPDKTHIAFMINMISVVSSAFTALFTCWITTKLSKKIVDKLDWEDNLKLYTTLFAGAVAGLTCTFADSIWFNAVEAEVYALSGFFTAIVVWLMLKWEERADESDHLRWIVLIAYIMGLSIGVHLLNLLTIPALAIIYYFRKYPVSLKGIAITLGISIAILAFVQYGIIQYTVSIAQSFELYFTGAITREGTDRGGLGFSMGTGTMVFSILLMVIVLAALWWSVKKQNVVLNMVVLCYIVIMLGFSSYTTIFVRSGANPSIDMNNPENVLTFLSYMRREQYGDRPLFLGALYNAIPKNDGEKYIFKKEGMRYTIWDGKDKYIEDEEKTSYDYETKDLVLFPRMYSEDMSRHYNGKPYGYADFVRQKGDERTIKDDKPTRFEDFQFFWQYQMVHMYLRYFMWNFVGRESDIQDDGWEDGLILNNHAMANNKGQNHYYFLPLLLGIMGMLWQFTHSKRGSTIVGLLFFFTGIAIIIYLNQTPMQPRERDYAYASSFQTFCIWVGMGVLFLVETIRVWTKKGWLHQHAHIAAGSAALLAPIMMCVQNWDDHSRKNRWIDVDFAYNLLNSCAKNALLFTAGDNDTFPLWYAQEVEGIRTDVRVVNLELLISDWYIQQMQGKTNESQPLPISMKKNDYQGEKFNFYDYSDRKFRYPINKTAVSQNMALTSAQSAMLVDTFVWDFKARSSSYVLRKDSVVINLIRNIANANWNRPVYFANTIPNDNYLGLDDRLYMEGLAHRLIPLKATRETPRDFFSDGFVNQEKMFENMTKVFKYRALDNPKLNADEHIRTTIISNYRNTFHRLAASYSEKIMDWQFEYDLAKAGYADTLQKMQVDINQALTENPAKIKAAQEKLKEIHAFSQKVMPYTAIEPTMNYLIMSAQMLYRGQLDKEADAEFAIMTKTAMAQLQNFHDNRIAVDPRHTSFQGVAIASQYYMETGREKEANAIAAEVQALTGSDFIIERLKKMKEKRSMP